MDLDWCPHVATLVCTHIAQGQTVLIPIRCKRWSCSYCWIPNEIALKEKVHSGNPNRMLTLTARPEDSDTPLSMHQRIKPKISRLYQLLRRTVGRFEAATFLELHRSGFPHWHALVRSDFIPWRTIRDAWQSLTGALVVDIRAIHDPAVARRYVTKYVTKQMRMVRGMRLGQVVSFTRHYSLRVKSDPAKEGWTYTRDRRHPIEVAEQSYTGFEATWKGRICTLTWPTAPFTACASAVVQNETDVLSSGPLPQLNSEHSACKEE